MTYRGGLLLLPDDFRYALVISDKGGGVKQEPRNHLAKLLLPLLLKSCLGAAGPAHTLSRGCRGTLSTPLPGFLSFGLW